MEETDAEYHLFPVHFQTYAIVERLIESNEHEPSTYGEFRRTWLLNQ